MLGGGAGTGSMITRYRGVAPVMVGEHCSGIGGWDLHSQQKRNCNVDIFLVIGDALQ